MDESLPSADRDADAPVPIGDERATVGSTEAFHDANGVPDTAALIAEIGRLTRLVGFLRLENERLAAERHDFRLRLEMQPNQGRRGPGNAKP